MSGASPQDVADPTGCERQAHCFGKRSLPADRDLAASPAIDHVARVGCAPVDVTDCCEIATESIAHTDGCLTQGLGDRTGIIDQSGADAEAHKMCESGATHPTLDAVRQGILQTPIPAKRHQPGDLVAINAVESSGVWWITNIDAGVTAPYEWDIVAHPGARGCVGVDSGHAGSVA